MRSKLSPLIKLWYSPAQGMTELAGQSPYVAGAILAFAASFTYGVVLSGELSVLLSAGRNGVGVGSPWLFVQVTRRFMSCLSPLLFLSVVFTPACLAAANLLDRRSSFGVLLRQEYAPFVSAVLYSWAAAHLIMLVAAGLTALMSTWPVL